jgi:hypothetical protein
LQARKLKLGARDETLGVRREGFKNSKSNTDSESKSYAEGSWKLCKAQIISFWASGQILILALIYLSNGR